MLEDTHTSTLGDTLEHIAYLRRLGEKPDRAIASVGARPVSRAGWDDATWIMARRLHALRYGASTHEM
jgi:hypothetical protein